ncbi:hypothetical protein E2C01_010203 [Portunus trituberculatus]|uniref:Uncharacterized protein n=1 Tax=Portunus trituberculatus TaxID=210409 RepID=A0A5B7D7V9_PORTR|nr:hypothetical protein [Portunus trituberculatus]
MLINADQSTLQTKFLALPERQPVTDAVNEVTSRSVLTCQCCLRLRDSGKHPCIPPTYRGGGIVLLGGAVHHMTIADTGANAD